MCCLLNFLFYYADVFVVFGCGIICLIFNLFVYFPFASFPLQDELLVEVLLNVQACFFVECLHKRGRGDDVVCRLAHAVLYGGEDYLFDQ